MNAFLPVLLCIHLIYRRIYLIYRSFLHISLWFFCTWHCTHRPWHSRHYPFVFMVYSISVVCFAPDNGGGIPTMRNWSSQQIRLLSCTAYCPQTTIDLFLFRFL